MRYVSPAVREGTAAHANEENFNKAGEFYERLYLISWRLEIGEKREVADLWRIKKKVGINKEGVLEPVWDMYPRNIFTRLLLIISLLVFSQMAFREHGSNGETGNIYEIFFSPGASENCALKQIR